MVIPESIKVNKNNNNKRRKERSAKLKTQKGGLGKNG